MFMRIFASLLLLALATGVRADMLVLVHGYLSGGPTWDHNGVTVALQQNGWRHGGVYSPGPALVPGNGAKAEKRYYHVGLPSEAPVIPQRDLLLSYLLDLQNPFQFLFQI